MKSTVLPPVAVVHHPNASVGVPELSIAARGQVRLVLIVDPATAAPQKRLLAAIGSVVESNSRETEKTASQLRDHGIRGITTFCDVTLAETGRLADRLGLPFHSGAVVARLSDKQVQRRALAAAGVATPVFAAIDTPGAIPAALAAVPLPAVVKPRSGAGSRNTVRVTNAATGNRLLHSLFAAGESGLILEEELVGDPAQAGPDWGDYVSVETASAPGRRRHLGVTGKTPLAEPYRETGAVYPSTLSRQQQEELYTATDRVLEVLEVQHGLTHTEWKLTSAGPRLIEVNGRLGGYINDLYLRATGRDLARIALLLSLGTAVDLPELVPDGVTAQIFTLPPAQAQVLTGWTVDPGLDQLAGVERSAILAVAHQQLDWRTGTSGRLSCTHTHTPDHAALLDLRRELASRLRFSYDQPPAVPEPSGSSAPSTRNARQHA